MASTGPAGKHADRLVLGCALAAFLACAARFAFVCDDAFIAFRYARHLAEGAGLVFNSGESPPVEGFSDLLWVLWIAPWIRLGVDPVPVANATSILTGAALLVLVLRWTRARGVGPLAAGLAGVFLATLPTFAVWATGGLETMPFALCTFLVFERLTLEPGRPRIAGACVAAALASLLRVDGSAWAAMAGIAAWCAMPQGERGSLRRALVPLALTLAATAAGLAAFRLAVFGELLPNTAHAKAELSATTLERGAKYAATWLGTLPGVLVAAVLGLASSAGYLRRPARAAALFLGLGLTYAVLVGGDFLPFGRFLVPATPFAALALALGLGPRPDGARIGAATTTIALSLAASFGRAPLPASARQVLHFRWNEELSKSELDAWRGVRDRAQHWRELGRALACATTPGESIVLGNIGAIGYETELVIHDPFGLVDREVARRPGPFPRASPGHDKGVPIDFFLPRRPTYLAAWLSAASPGAETALPPALEALRARGEAVVERRELAPACGFAPGISLLLARYVPPPPR
jgi:arabinofuranosyltransferase